MSSEGHDASKSWLESLSPEDRQIVIDHFRTSFQEVAEIMRPLVKQMTEGLTNLFNYMSYHGFLKKQPFRPKRGQSNKRGRCR